MLPWTYSTNMKFLRSWLCICQCMFLKALLVLDTFFQETQSTAYVWTKYRLVWRTLTALHTPAALRTPSVWTYLLGRFTQEAGVGR